MGDGDAHNRDFRVYRDASLQAQVEAGTLAAGLVALDGKAEGRKDLNQDGCVGSAVCPPERFFSRYDFNGDGLIADFYRTSPFKIDPDSAAGTSNSTTLLPMPGMARDIDVLADKDTWTVDEEEVSVSPRTSPGSARTCPSWART